LVESTGKKEVNQRNLNFVAKYWYYKGLKDEAVYKKVEEFCLSNDKEFNLIINRIKIKSAVSHAKRYGLRLDTIPVYISQDELKRIEKLDNEIYEKIIFIMLVCARYFRYNISRKRVRKNKNVNVLYSNQKVKDILFLAGVKATKKEWNKIKHDLCVKGYISPTIVSKDKFALSFSELNEETPNRMGVIDYRNIIAYYQQYRGEFMIHCSSCGVLTIRKGGNHKMCLSCSRENRKLLVRKNVQCNRFKNKWKIN